MVRRVVVIKGKTYISNTPTIMSFEQYANGVQEQYPSEYLEYFDLMTTNFHELGYWNAHDDLHNKNAEQGANNIKNTLKKIRNDGYKRYDKEEEKPYLTW